MVTTDSPVDGEYSVSSKLITSSAPAAGSRSGRYGPIVAVVRSVAVATWPKMVASPNRPNAAEYHLPPLRGDVIRNWGGNPALTWRPGLTFRPSSSDEVGAVVRRAIHEKRILKPLGRRHSYSGVLTAPHDSYALDLSAMSGLLGEPAGNHATFAAGTPLSQAIELLYGQGLAFSNLGSHADQTVAGAVSTNTHGTGRRWPGFSGMVTALDFWDGTGHQHRRISRQNQAELFRALRCSFGALGVVTATTVEARPGFKLRLERTVEPLSPYFDQQRLNDEIEGSEWFELYVLPYTRHTVVLKKRETDEPISAGRDPRARGPLGELWASFGDHFRAFVVNDLYRLRVQIMLKLPQLTDEIFSLEKQVLTWLEDSFVDRSDRALLAEYERRPWNHLWEVEFFFPVEYLGECLQAVCTLLSEGMRARTFVTEFPIHVRTVRGDDSYMSPTYCEANQRVFGAIGVPQNPLNDRGDLFVALTQALDAVMSRHGERPVGLHWGKSVYTGRDRLEDRYPGLEAFRRVRRELDPNGVFLTPWTSEALKL